ncbi:MAG: alpha-hydroxy acid oxidase, partial [Bacteroidota bacterium]|nr:alpha-hydroxy acid oxidase [Bacteroidota bacterium]
MNILNLQDIEQEAALRLDSNALEYYRGGAADELTLRRNRSDFDDIVLYPRVLRDVSHRSLRCTLLGQTFDMPIGIAPTAMQCLAHHEGERATAHAAVAMNVPMILSTTSTIAVEDVAQVEGVQLWFQVYVYKDRATTQEIVQRAVHAGCTALVLTVDAPYLGKREREARIGFHLPEHLCLPHYTRLQAAHVPAHQGESGLVRHFAQNIDPALTWNDILWLEKISGVPVIVKGIMRADDAIQAAAYGARGIIVSNHGGRQLDTVQSSIRALPAVADAVGH